MANIYDMLPPSARRGGARPTMAATQLEFENQLRQQQLVSDMVARQRQMDMQQIEQAQSMASSMMEERLRRRQVAMQQMAAARAARPKKSYTFSRQASPGVSLMVGGGPAGRGEVDILHPDQIIYG